MRMRTSSLLVAGLVLVSGCSGTRTVEITEASVDATGRVLFVTYQGCHPSTAKAEVQESPTAVTIRIQVQGGTEGDCPGFTEVRLSSDLGTREVVDASSGKEVEIRHAS